jgi:hypothetical protein
VVRLCSDIPELPGTTFVSWRHASRLDGLSACGTRCSRDEIVLDQLRVVGERGFADCETFKGISKV